MPCAGYHPQAPSGLGCRPCAAPTSSSAVPQWPPMMRRLRRSGARLVFDLYVPEAIETVGGFPGDRRRCARCSPSSPSTASSTRCGAAGLRLRQRAPARPAPRRDAGRAAHRPRPPRRRPLAALAARRRPVRAARGAARARRATAARRVPDAIGPDDEVVLWNGGLWPWLDAETAVRAVAALAARRPSAPARVHGRGAAGPRPARRRASRARVAAELGVLDRVVLFNDGWVPYERRADWLLAAACAISTHGDHLETRFAFRTRLLDCFWARLPVVCTRGDDLADVVERAGAGHDRRAGDVGAAAAAIETVLDRGRDAYASAARGVAARYAWPGWPRAARSDGARGTAPGRRVPLRPRGARVARDGAYPRRADRTQCGRAAGLAAALSARS